MGAFDEIILKYGQPQGSVPAAQARFSRAPISFVDFAKSIKDFSQKVPSLLPRELGPPLPPAPSGEYDPRSRAITLTVTPFSIYEQMQHIASHEDVHAVLDSVGRSRTELPPQLNSLPDDLEKRFKLPPFGLDARWALSGRSGNFNAEIPAYLTAYRPSEIYGVTPDMAQSWVNSYSQTLPEDAKSKILRLGEISRGVPAK